MKQRPRFFSHALSWLPGNIPSEAEASRHHNVDA